MAKQPTPIIWLNPAFKLLIYIVTVAMGVGFVGLFVLAICGSDPPRQLQTRFAEALVGLLCGRAGAPDK
jgi:hypothetical protein